MRSVCELLDSLPTVNNCLPFLPNALHRGLFYLQPTQVALLPQVPEALHFVLRLFMLGSGVVLRKTIVQVMACFAVM